VQWTLRAFPRGVKRPGREADRLHQAQRIGMSGALLTSYRVPSQHAQGQKYFIFVLVREIDDLCVARSNEGYVWKIGVSAAKFCTGLPCLIRKFVHQFIRTSYRASDLDLSSVTCPTWWSRLAVCTNRYKDASIDCTPPRPAAGVALPHSFCCVE
jgi:hypothetical protein